MIVQILKTAIIVLIVECAQNVTTAKIALIAQTAIIVIIVSIVGGAKGVLIAKVVRISKEDKSY